jgi:hypothetical protein
MKCPVCDKNIKNIEDTQFCPQCGWELIVIPTKSPDELTKFYQEKEKLHKASYLAHKENVEKLSKLKQKFQTETDKSIRLVETVKRLQEKKEKLQKTLEDAKGKICIVTSKKKDMEKQKKDYEQKLLTFNQLKNTAQSVDKKKYDIFCHIITLSKLYEIK